MNDRRLELWSVKETDSRSIPIYQSSVAAPSQTVLIAIHGLGDHGQALPYQFLAEAMASRGHRVITFDHRGHGPRAARLGGARSWISLREDLAAVTNVVRAAYPEARVIAVGLSMGALLTLDLALSAPSFFDAIVLASAPLGPVRASKVVLATARFLSQCAPGVRLRARFDPNAISRDHALRNEYVGDELFHDSVTARLASEIVAVAERVRGQGDSLATSTFLLHGLADRIAPWDSTFNRTVPPGICDCKLYEGAFHNLFIDTNRTEVFADLLRWLEAKATNGAAA